MINFDYNTMDPAVEAQDQEKVNQIKQCAPIFSNRREKLEKKKKGQKLNKTLDHEKSNVNSVGNNGPLNNMVNEQKNVLGSAYAGSKIGFFQPNKTVLERIEEDPTKAKVIMNKTQCSKLVKRQKSESESGEQKNQGGFDKINNIEIKHETTIFNQAKVNRGTFYDTLNTTFYTQTDSFYDEDPSHPNGNKKHHKKHEPHHNQDTPKNNHNMGNDDESSETAADLGNDFSLLLQEKLEDEKVKLRQ